MTIGHRSLPLWTRPPKITLTQCEQTIELCCSNITNLTVKIRPSAVYLRARCPIEFGMLPMYSLVRMFSATRTFEDLFTWLAGSLSKRGRWAKSKTRPGSQVHQPALQQKIRPEDRKAKNNIYINDDGCPKLEWVQKNGDLPQELLILGNFSVNVLSRLLLFLRPCHAIPYILIWQRKAHVHKHKHTQRPTRWSSIRCVNK